jgi:hypothetical protein
MTNPQEDRAGETEVELEAADAAAGSGSATAAVPDDDISRAAAAVGSGREDSVRGSGTNLDAPDTIESDDDRETTRTGDTDRWS